MNRKVIFADIDGVLCTYRSTAVHKGLMQVLDPVGVKMLQRLIDQSGAKLVLSSTWRLFHNKDSMTSILMNAGLERFEWHDVWCTKDSPSLVDRGSEIADWLNDNEVDNYLILDDAYVYQKSNWVRTTMQDGISYQNYLQARKILGLSDEGESL